MCDNLTKTSAGERERKRILLIDDTEAYLFILNDILKNDYETIIAKNGADGLEIAKLTMPDLIVLDLIMPNLSGYDVLKILKTDDIMKSIPVVLITGKDSEDDIAKGYELGAAGYIRKPFDNLLVKDMIDSIIKCEK